MSVRTLTPPGFLAIRAHELGVRILGRAHVEAWLTGTYLHFGGQDALRRIAEDTLRETEVTHKEINNLIRN